MGFDISYHPISTEEVQNWYFNVLENPSLAEKLGEEYEIDPFYIDKYKEVIDVALKTTTDDPFDTTHGYYIAVIQGLFRKYFYTRGSGFSFLIEEKGDFAKYTTEWQKFIPVQYTNPIANILTQNYSSGIYISAEQVKELLSDFENNEKTKEDLLNFYSHGRIDVFIEALKYSAENNLGLLEATEVVEPNPFDLNNSVSYSNLFNCDTAGALLYREAALVQIREIENNNNLSDEEIDDKVQYKKITSDELPTPAKKSFWKKIFGK